MTSSLSPIRIAMGGVLVVAALWLAYQSWDDAHYTYLRTVDPRAAHAKRPTDAAALSKYLDDRLQKQQQTAISEPDFAQVKAAIAKAPLTRGLLRIVGMKAELQGDAPRAETAISLSDSLSRRDALTQLWLIERSVGRNDMNGAVRHYHAALSVHPELGPTLLPILSRAIAFPEVRKALSPYIARQSRWSLDFLDTAIVTAKPADIASLLLPIGDVVRGGPYEKVNARLITLLVEAGDFGLAGKFAQAVIPRFNPAIANSLVVNDATTDKRLGMLAWTLADDGRVLTTSNEQGGLEIDVEPLARGMAATRTIPIVGGKSYTFSQTLRGGSDVLPSSNWLAFCVPSSSSEPLWQEKLPMSRRTQRYQAVIAVPASCRGLRLVLIVRGPEGQQPAHAAFEAFDLKPVLN